MNLKLAHLGDLIGMRFNIPYYQRGYRWETKQVLDLLDDLFEFQQSNPEPGSFYCLQPLVVCKNSVLSNENFVVFDVIDGQQRLTTLFLMMKHLSLNAFGLRYERAVIREESPNLWENGRLDYKVLQSFSDKEMADNPDYFYMKQAMACIDGWIAEKKNEFPRIEDLMKDVLQDRNYKNSDLPFYELTEDKNSKQSDVRFIWYEDEATGGSSIDTFKRLNYGKTPLTATELIKALLLQCDVYKNRKAEMKQIAFRMSTEWDAMGKPCRMTSCGRCFSLLNMKKPLASISFCLSCPWNCRKSMASKSRHPGMTRITIILFSTSTLSGKYRTIVNTMKS